MLEVAVSLPVFGTYTYSVPDALQDAVAYGKRVLVLFGRRKSPATSWDQPETTTFPGIKHIIEIFLDEIPLFPRP
ncbi:MAG: hypothetical protein R2861_03695 [Desulfobacterales bacterium]